MSTESFRFYTMFRTILNTQAKLMTNYILFNGDQLPSLRTTERLSKLFREGRKEIENEARPDRSIIEITSENIEQICLLIDDDSCLTNEKTNACR